MLMPKWSKFLMTCKLETCNVFFILSSVIQGGLFSSFVQQSNFQSRKLLPFHTWVDSDSDLFTQRVKKKKKKSIQTHKPLFLFWRKAKKKFFFFFMKGTEKNKRERETIANKCFVIHNCMLFAVVMVIIQLCVVSPVSSCLCILWVSFCLLLLWLF